MKKLLRAGLSALLMLIIFTGVRQSAVLPVSADDGGTRPKRITTIDMDYTLYRWWLLSWETNTVVCDVLADHEGLPTGAEVYFHCGKDIYEDWMATDACSISTSDQKQDCEGLYLHLAGSTREQKQVKIELPMPQVWVSITGCDPQGPGNSCTSQPGLLFTAEEPLPNEQIISVNGVIFDQPFTCPGGQCILPLPATGTQGTTVTFWADSSYGDSSPLYTARVRVIPWGDFMAPEGEKVDEPLWYVDVLSAQWRGKAPASCADIWEVFPDVGGPSAWLTSPDTVEGLQSSVSYYYLAAQLIRNGLVDASHCPGGGFSTNTTANECGVETAAPVMTEWQNRFNSEILNVSQDTGVPAQLMKNIFSRESQFWPGIYDTLEEAGLGQMTVKGADTVLLWNPTFFQQFCPLVLDQSFCAQGFRKLEPQYQSMLRGALVTHVNATCLNCPVGINLTQANFSINVFAETLRGNCQQVAQMVENTTKQKAGYVSTYDDLWRMTLANYNAGPGCLGKAVEEAWFSGRPLVWDEISPLLDPACQGAVNYVEDISRMPEPAGAPQTLLGDAGTADEAAVSAEAAPSATDEVVSTPEVPGGNASTIP